MNRFFVFLARAMGDGENPSASRLITVAIVPASVLVPLLVWALLCWHARAMLEFPASVTGFMTAANTLTLGALHLNKREETKVETSPT